MRAHLTALVTVVALATAAAAVGAASGAAATGRQGVTDDEILVGGLAGLTNPLGLPFADGSAGVQAYFDVVNANGGVFGRELRIVDELDDRSSATLDLAQARTLVDDEKVFAVIPVVTMTFGAASYLAQKGIPTFGWNINDEWKDAPNLFGQRGSFTCFTCTSSPAPYIAERIGAKKVALVSYGSGQSLDCAKGTRASLEQYGYAVTYADTDLRFGFTDVSADVQAIENEGIDYVASCLDINGNVALAKAMHDADVSGVRIYAPEGYDPDVLRKYGHQLDGFYFAPDFLPFQDATHAKAMRQLIAALKERNRIPNEQSLAGWVVGQLLVDGIKAAGPNFTWRSVVAAINRMRSFTAGDLVPPIDWTQAHTSAGHADCHAYVAVAHGKFVRRFGAEGKPFVCFPYDPGPARLDHPTYR